MLSLAKEKKNEEEQELVLTAGESFRMDMYFWLQALVVALVALILVFTFVGRLIGVKGASMQPTLYAGDMVLLQTIGYTPEQNDIVVVRKLGFSEDAIIKRVIAVGGQTVTINYNNSTVMVDGVVLDEPYINEQLMSGSGILETYVEPGHIFVMGDNRNHSSDSRSTSIGLIDLREVLGGARMVVLPFSDFGVLH